MSKEVNASGVAPGSWKERVPQGLPLVVVRLCDTISHSCYPSTFKCDCPDFCVQPSPASPIYTVPASIHTR